MIAVQSPSDVLDGMPPSIAVSPQRTASGGPLGADPAIADPRPAPPAGAQRGPHLLLRDRVQLLAEWSG